MEVILLMAGETILRCGLHIGDGAVIDVTTGALHQRVFADQVEGDLIMIESFAM